MDASTIQLPRLYPILDRDVLAHRGLDLLEAARELVDAGCPLLQYRNKTDPAGVVFEQAERLREHLSPAVSRLILNDRVDLARLARFEGAHVGQSDLAPIDARRVLAPDQLLGRSTHSLEQFRAALAEPVDYIAIGPIFVTSTKSDADPVVGLDLLRAARALTSKPIVAIGGITLANAPSVLGAGADSVAIIGALFSSEASLTKNVRRFFRALA